MWADDHALFEMWQEGHAVDAVRAYREKHSCSLDEAKKFFIAMDAAMRKPTLRDQFAMAAITGLCFGRGTTRTDPDTETVIYFAPHEIVEDAYRIADEAMNQRNKP